MAEQENLVYDRRYTSVVPGKIVGEDNSRDLTALDLAFKFHYIRAVYFFSADAVHGMRPGDFKNPMFEWLIPYFTACGRIRISESGRPFIRLNDAGIRIIEARCSRTVDEWLGTKDFSAEDELVCDDAHGHDLGFIPLVFIQMTWFKCGGMSMGLNWAHVLGDVFSASAFMNGLTQFLKGEHPSLKLLVPDPPEPQCSRSIASGAHSLKRIHPSPTANIWKTVSTRKMTKHTFQIPATRLDHINSTINQVRDPEIGPFELISAILWKSIAAIRGNSPDPSIITVCRNKRESKDRGSVLPYNGLEVGTIEVKFSASEADLMKLATAFVEEVSDETGKIEEIVEEELGEGGKSDYVVYGSKLTFLDMEGVDSYGLKVKGHSPIFVNYGIVGVGEEGAVLVFPGPGDGDRLATVILPENEVGEVRNKVEQEWSFL